MKRPYLLLEVLISLALVALCAAPLLRPQLEIRNKERQLLLEIQEKLAADEAFDLIRLKFYTHEILWEDLQRNKEVKGAFPLLACTYNIKENDKYKKSTRATYRLNEVEISFGKNRNHTYYLFTERVDPMQAQS